MAGCLLFAILTYSFYKIQTHALFPPKLAVDSSVITETDSVTLDCQTQPWVNVQACYFYSMIEAMKKGSSCQWNQTGTELLLMSGQSSPAKVEVKCFYTVKYGDTNSPSPHSDATSIIVGHKPQMSLSHFPGDYVSFICSLSGSANDDTRCNLYFGKAHHLTSNISHRRTSQKQRFCWFDIRVDVLLRRLHSVEDSVASCDYTLGNEHDSLSPRSDGYSLTYIVERESHRTQTMPTFTKTTGPTASRTPSVTPVTPAKQTSDIVERESSEALTQPAVTITTDLSVGRPDVSTSVTPVKSSSDQRPQPSVESNLFPVTPLNQALETRIWQLLAFMAGFGITVGVIVLGLALWWNKRRTERSTSSYKRTKAMVTGDFICMTNIDHGGLITAGHEINKVITTVPDCPTGSEKKSKQASHSEDSGIYHVYSTIPEEPPPSAVKHMVYSNVQSH